MTCVYNILFLINLISSYFRSEESGNCLHSYVSVAMVEDNSLVESLRVNGWLLQTS